MFRDYFAWWIEQLTDLLPAGWGRLGATREDALVIEPLGPLSGEVDGIRVNLRHRGRESLLGSYGLTADSMAGLPRRPRRWVLRLRPADVLAKTLTLPIAAERQIHEALALQMDQETPFAPDEIYWSHFITERDRQSGRLSVRLLLVPRQSLAALLRALDHVGIVPNRAEIGNGPDQGHALPLDGDGWSLTGAQRSGLHWLVAACCLLLVLGTIATPFVWQAISLTNLDREISTARVKAAEAEKLYGELGRLS